MGILRTDIISHSQLEGSGSVEFDGDGDSLTFTTTGGLSLDTDFTIEFYIYNNTIALDTQHPSPITMPTDGSAMSQIYTNSSNVFYGLYKSGDIVTTGNNSALTGVWQHVAFTRKGSICFAFLDGVLKNTAVSTVTFGGTSGTYRIGSYNGSGGDVNGFISNLRIIKGTAIYTANFTVPKFELKNIAGTTLLGCQSTTSATDFAVTPNTITANNDAAASSFHPSLKKDITDTGVVFDGVTTFDSLAYMVPPSGKTTERNRGRGLFAGGDGSQNLISFIQIQSLGNAGNFGDLTQARLGAGAVGSSTRGVMSAGYTSSNVNTIDFITIANTSNATDFGDSTQERHEMGSSSSETRGIFGGGTAPSLTNIIDFVTIATAGNAANFGDLTVVRRNLQGVSSPTRSVFAGGRDPSGNGLNTIDFVTIASAGDATDFGDLTAGRGRFGSVCSNTRGVFCGGETPTFVNTIDFITIASAGNATDFGDTQSVIGGGPIGGASNNTRGVFCITYIAPANVNTMEFVTIATTGNSADFGDNYQAVMRNAGFSDSHGGLE